MFQSRIIPDIDRSICAGFKSQVTPAENIHKWPEGFTEIDGSCPGVGFRGKHIIDDTTEQYAFPSPRRRQCQGQWRAHLLAIKKIDSDEPACRQRKQGMWTRRS